MDAERIRDDELIDLARAGDREALGALLDRHRADLMRLSRRHLEPVLSRRLDASDIVQQTFLEATQSFDRFRGGGGPEFQVWLRRILEFNLAGAIRDNLVTRKRAAGREQFLDDSRGSGQGLRRWLTSGGSSPSLRAIRLEQTAEFLDALRQLPDDQREAVQLRHLEGWSLDAISAHLGRSPEAAAGLLKRGVRALRDRLRRPEEP